MSARWWICQECHLATRLFLSVDLRKDTRLELSWYLYLPSREIHRLQAPQTIHNICHELSTCRVGRQVCKEIENDEKIVRTCRDCHTEFENISHENVTLTWYAWSFLSVCFPWKIIIFNFSHSLALFDRYLLFWDLKHRDRRPRWDCKLKHKWTDERRKTARKKKILLGSVVIRINTLTWAIEVGKVPEKKVFTSRSLTIRAQFNWSIEFVEPFTFIDTWTQFSTTKFSQLIHKIILSSLKLFSLLAPSFARWNVESVCEWVHEQIKTENEICFTQKRKKYSFQC